MQLLFIRHGKAGEREDFKKLTGRPDSERPLTRQGKQQMKAGARGLARLYPRLDVLATSPLKRAVQTASVISKAYGDKPEFLEVVELSPGKRPALLLDWIKSHMANAAHNPDYTIALVGHEPHLGRCVSWLLTHKERAAVDLKKGEPAYSVSLTELLPGEAF